MSQFFRFRTSVIGWALLFKDSKRGPLYPSTLLPRGLVTLNLAGLRRGLARKTNSRVRNEKQKALTRVAKKWHSPPSAL